MNIGILSTAHMHVYSYMAALRRLGVPIVGIYDDDAERGRRAAEATGVPFFPDAEPLLAQVDAVVVCSENANHKRDVLAAARHGRHILCEKPIATSVADALEMIRACQQAGVILQMAFPVRYIAAVRQLRDLVQAGRLGRILAMRGTNHGYMPGGWFIDHRLAGGGAVMDHTVHVADIMRWILGAEVRRVYAEIDNRVHQKDIDDCGILTIEFDNGVFATLDPSWSRTDAYPIWGDVTLEVVGSGGTASLDAFAAHLNVYSVQDGKGVHEGYGEDMDYYLIKDFVETVAAGRQPLVDGVDGLRAMEVALAAYESAARGEPVEVTLAAV
ncbi:dehydrogenase [Alicyclobacillus cellulosilyticus]|uniref:Dehydrogenase n=1 Tax=Alicyclobacillus cellulosilyticus TaxID=1003997 RepID=A0A917KBB4_9BACL|nr:Gfo/Idh/MocA family oxidoreductase [Alicyclobacillus cellulosilyticus]GGJ06349.1 dehydrogenase [Alicyclobacillus cellulosilyticus]